MKTWYSVQAKAGAPAADISIFDEIGLWGVTAKDFIGELKAIDAPLVRLAINSPGGSVFDAIAIYNALRQHPAAIEVTVMGVAASAASLIAMAGDTIVMPENAYMMIHNPLNFAYGNASDLRDMADVLDKIGAGLVATYVARTGQPEADIRALLDAETWLTAEEAVNLGFADEVQAALKVAARFDLERLPESIRAAIAPASAVEPPAPLPTAPDSRALATAIVAKAAAAGLGAYADAFLLDPAIQTEAAADLALAEATEVVAVCKAGGLPDMAGDLIKARVPVATVRARLMAARVALDQATQVAHHIPQPTPAPQSAVSIAGIYAARRQ